MQRCTLVLDVAQRLNYFEIRVLCKRTLSVKKVCPQRSAFVVVAGVLQNGKLARFLIEITKVVGSSGLFVAVVGRAFT